MKKYLLVLAACGSSPSARPADAAPDRVTPDGVAIDAPVRPPADGPSELVLTGAIAPVHDPSIIQADGIYYVFSTGTGIQIRSSTNLTDWSLAGQVFQSQPTWITTTTANDLWAPDISYRDGLYHLYYAASSFGSNESCIGHATTASLSAPAWTDLGAVVCSHSSDNFNAIDPAAFADADGNWWLAFGSFWSGLQLVPLDAAGARAGTDQYALGTRGNTAIEAPYVVHHGSAYYLFSSIDYCCQGTASTYKISSGRASDPRGPYLDEASTPLLSGGGTVLVQGDARWKGPGHNAMIATSFGDYLVYHAYDANAGGTPTLRMSLITWPADDSAWPAVAGP